MLGGVNALHTAFPDNAEEEYQVQAQMILERLNLQDILEEEMKQLKEIEARQKEVKASGKSLPVKPDENVVSPHVARIHRVTENQIIQPDEHQSKENQSRTDPPYQINEQIDHDNLSFKFVDNVNEISKKQCGVKETGTSGNLDKVANAGLNLSNVSLSDMLNSSGEDGAEMAPVFPVVGANLGAISQSSLNSSVVVNSRNFQVLPSNASTPLRSNKSSDKQACQIKVAKEADEQQDDEGQIKGNPSVIQQTIQNRLTQATRKMPLVTTGTEDNELADDSVKRSAVAKLVCVKDKKSNQIGKFKTVSGKMKKALENIVKETDIGSNSESGTGENDRIEHLSDFEDDLPRTKTKSRKREIVSDSDDNDNCSELDKNILVKKSKRRKQKENNESYNGSVTASKANHNKPEKFFGDIEATNSPTKAVSNSTLSKLKRFQFDESKSSILSNSSFSEPIASSTSVTTKNENNTRTVANGQTLSYSSGMKVNQTGNVQVEDQPVMTNVLIGTFDEQKKVSPASVKSPAWLVTLNKKFASPVLTNNITNNSSAPKPVFNVEVKSDELEDLELDDCGFLSKLKYKLGGT